MRKVGAYDVWWHLKAAEQILRTGAIPDSDPFSFTAYGRPWVYHSWLSGMALFLFHGLGGTVGLVVARALVAAASSAIVWAVARRRGVDAGLTSILIVAAFFQLQVRALCRPYMFSFLFFAIFHLLLQRAFCAGRLPPTGGSGGRLSREDSFLWGKGGHLLILPCLMLLWVNMHAGFLVGLILIGAYGFAEMVALAAGSRPRNYLSLLLREERGARFRALLVAGTLCLAASAITPYGAGVLMYPFRLLAEVKLVRQVLEWQPTPFKGDFFVFWAMLALFAVVYARSCYHAGKSGVLRPELAQFVVDLLLVGGFAFLAARTVRHMSWFLLAAPPIVGYHICLCRSLAAREDEAEGSAWSEAARRRFYARVAPLFAAVVCFQQLLTGNLGFGLAEGKFPVQACDFMASHNVGGRLYNVYEWGGYVIWRFWPRERVFIDGRCLVYGDPIIGQALDVAHGREGWGQVLDDWDVGKLLLNHRKYDCAHFFEAGGWHCVYWDDYALVAVSDEVAAEAPEMKYFPLSNPAVFDRMLDTSDPDALLAELDSVIAEQPECWTALAERARALVKISATEPEQKQKQKLLSKALEDALESVRLAKRQSDPWRALCACYEALGSSKDAKAASRKAESLAE